MFDFCAGLRRGVLRGKTGSGLFVRRLVFEWAVFGRREAKLLRHLVLRLSLLVEAELPQQLVDLRAGHVRQGDPLRRTHTGETMIIVDRFSAVVSHFTTF